ncbi:acyltransferase [Schaalia sp. lx-100]|uniref:acyltransferase n=1 Tax=Schaalia sp. lx-100 TaxID=2899081 RepID=UPI001E351080|nr:acyltransferase [Schaalia sp. lx-100]MCD4556645.1 acyltransferase [Schaalia sp. lx-100]
MSDAARHFNESLSVSRKNSVSVDTKSAQAHRQYEFDVIRALAIIGVVAVHSLILISNSTSRPLQLLFIGSQTLFFIGNPLFFLMSGHFNIRAYDTKEKLTHFWYARAKGIIIPVACYLVIRSIYNVLMYEGIQNIGNVPRYFLKNLLLKEGFTATEYWFIYVLIGYLLMTPFVSKGLNTLTPFAQKSLLIIGLAYQTAATLFTNLGYQFSLSLPISGFFFVFCIGAFVNTLFCERKYRIILYICGIGTYLLDCYLILRGYNINAQDTSPLFIITALAVYVFLLNACANIKENRLISFIARHSFGVYLCHMMVLIPTAQYLETYTDTSVLKVGGCVILCIFVLIVSLVFSVLVNKALVTPAQRLMDAIKETLNKRTRLN